MKHDNRFLMEIFPQMKRLFSIQSSLLRRKPILWWIFLSHFLSMKKKNINFELIRTYRLRTTFLDSTRHLSTIPMNFLFPRISGFSWLWKICVYVFVVSELSLPIHSLTLSYRSTFSPHIRWKIHRILLIQRIYNAVFFYLIFYFSI